MPSCQLVAENAEALANACELQQKIDKLHAQIDILLDPIAQKAASLPDDELIEVLSAMPSGFHSSELRALLYGRKLINEAGAGDTAPAP